MDLIRECEKYNIRSILLPPNGTHLTQFLDLSCFRPITGAWRQIFREWKKYNKGVHFPRLLKKALNEIEAKKEDMINSRFAGTGITPLSREKVLNRLP